MIYFKLIKLLKITLLMKFTIIVSSEELFIYSSKF